MGSKLEEGLRSVCCQYGWSYGIYWCIDGADSGFLTVGGAYYEKRLEKMLEGTLRQIHRIGDGVIGGAALTGRHQWIFSNVYLNEHSLDMLEDTAALNLHFLSGMETIAIVPLQPFGVFQFGSSQKIVENLEFFNRVQHMVQMPEIISELLGHGVSKFGHRNLNSMCSNRLVDTIPGKECSKTSSATSSEVRFDQSNSLHSNLISMPAQKSHTFTSNPLLLNSHRNAASIGDQILTSSATGLHQDSGGTTYSPFIELVNHGFNALNDDLMEQQILKMIGTQEFSATQPVVTHGNLDQEFFQDFRIASFENINGSQCVLPNRSHKIPASLPPSSANDRDHCSSKPLSQGPFSVEPNAESADFLMFSEDLPAECATSTITKSDAGNNMVKHEIDISTGPRNENLLGTPSVTSVFGCSSELASINNSKLPKGPAQILSTFTRHSSDAGSDLKDNNSGAVASPLLDKELFDGMELDLKNSSQGHSHWEDILISEECDNCTNLLEGLEGDLFSDFGLEQIVGGVAKDKVMSSISHSSTGSNINPVVTDTNIRNQYFSTTNVGSIPLYSDQFQSSVCIGRNTSILSKCNVDNHIQASSSNLLSRSQVSSWIDDCYSMNAANSATAHGKKSADNTKMPRKRARPGESTRPRPKDRQLIQDRVKELREIVPNGAKCSIDALLDRTIKHMLYLQNVRKYSEKLKQADDEPKMIGEEDGVMLRDNANGAGGGGATWAFEVAGQTMVCPIIVEDLSPPGQMLVEMLCEERGFFLEIAEVIRGFGLTILKGVMEVRNSKIWARFLVEANCEVTRMEIFLGLVQLLQQTTSNGGLAAQPSAKVEVGAAPRFDHRKQSSSPRIPICLPDRLQ